MQVQVAEYVEQRIHEHTEVWQSKIAEEIQRQLEITTAALQQRITEQVQEQSDALHRKGTAVPSEASKQKPAEELQRRSLSSANIALSPRSVTSSPQRARFRPTTLESRTASVRPVVAVDP